MSERLEAAVKAWDHHWGDRYGDEALEEMGEEVQVALDASEAVLFSEEAVERGAKALNEHYLIEWDKLPEWAREDARRTTRAVIAALKGAE